MAEEDERLTPEQQKLIDDHPELVKITAKKLSFRLRKHLGMNDLLAIGYMAMRACALTFDPLAGWKFSTYARHRIRGAMWNAFAKLADEEERVIALCHAAGHDYQATRARRGDTVSDMDGLAEERLYDHADVVGASVFAKLIGALKPATPEASVSMNEQWRKGKKGIRRVLSILPERDRRIVTLHFFEGWSLPDVAKELQIRHPGVYRQLERILQRFRRVLEAAGVTELPPREDDL